MKTLTCRYISSWLCTLYEEKDGKFTVSQEICQLCMKAKEITYMARVLETALTLPKDLDRTLQTLKLYIGRLERALQTLEKREATKA